LSFDILFEISIEKQLPLLRKHDERGLDIIQKCPEIQFFDKTHGRRIETRANVGGNVYLVR
jgi:hypothetical protein